MTNELDDKKLPTAYVVALYWQRWRIEDAYNKEENPSPLIFIPMLLTGFSNP